MAPLEQKRGAPLALRHRLGRRATNPARQPRSLHRSTSRLRAPSWQLCRAAGGFSSDSREGFSVHLAGHAGFSHGSEAAVRAGFAHLFAGHAIPNNAADAVAQPLFAERDAPLTGPQSPKGSGAPWQQDGERGADHLTHRGKAQGCGSPRCPRLHSPGQRLGLRGRDFALRLSRPRCLGHPARTWRSARSAVRPQAGEDRFHGGGKRRGRSPEWNQVTKLTMSNTGKPRAACRSAA